MITQIVEETSKQRSLHCLQQKVRKHLFFIVLIFICLVGLLLSSVIARAAVTDSPLPTARDAVVGAWELAQASGSYGYRSEINQTTYPAPSVTSAGRPPQEITVAIEGDIDLLAETMAMRLWTDGSYNPDTGIEVRVEDGLASARVGQGEWEPIENITDAFAPGGDPLGFLVAMDNIEVAESETRQFDNGTSLLLTAYTFDLNGAEYAAYLHRTLEEQLRQTGGLSPGMSLSVPEQDRLMAGTGKIWLTADGLPYRLDMNLEMPEQESGEVVHGNITTDFYAFDTERLSQLSVGIFQNPPVWLQARLDSAVASQYQQNVGMAVFLLCLMTLGLLVMHRLGLWRHHYRFIVGLYIVSSLVNPLLQGVGVQAYYSHEQQAAAAEAEQAQSEHAVAATQASDWNPHQDPLLTTASQVQLAAHNLTHSAMNALPAAITPLQATSNDTTDSDGDGLTDAEEAIVGTCDGATPPNQYCANAFSNTDFDGDTLNDGVEVNRLGTFPDFADSDGDLITDTLEVKGFFYAGTQWYLDPNALDTNKDGLPDGVECEAWVGASVITTTICPDIDGDGVPDVFDFDNDNDGVHDSVDLSPFAAGVARGPAFNQNTPLAVSVNNLQLNKPVVMELQLRPTRASNLTLFGNVLDWPTGDRDGQIQRHLNTTFASTANTELKSTDRLASNGDIRLIPMLEVTMPYANGHYANLPVTSTINVATTPRSLSNGLDTWLDKRELKNYNISVREVGDNSGNLIAYVPLATVSNSVGDEIQAFTGKMIYWPQQGSNGVVNWGSDHQYRLVWVVQMLTDKCNTSGASYNAEKGTCNNSDRTDELTVIHTYYDDWQLSGLNVSESHGLDVAIVYEDPANDPNPALDDEVWRASWNLSNTWLIGRDCGVGVQEDENAPCVPDNTLDVTIAGGGSADDVATAINKWSGNGSHLLVDRFLNYPHPDYIALVGQKDVASILTTKYGGYTDRTPTFLFAQESRVRSLSQGSNQVQVVGSRLTFDFNSNAVKMFTATTMSWSTYRYVNQGWQPYDLDSYLNRLDWQLQESDSYFSIAESASVNEAEERRFWAQLHYITLFGGISDIVAESGNPFRNITQKITLDTSWKETTSRGKGIGKIATVFLRAFTIAQPGAPVGQRITFGAIGLRGNWQQAFGAFSLGADVTARNDNGLYKPLTRVQKTGTLLAVATMTVYLVGLGLQIAGISSGKDGLAEVGKYLVVTSGGALAGLKLATIGIKVNKAVKALKGASVFLKLSTAVSTASKAAFGLKVAGGIGTLISVGFSTGMFFYVMGTQNLSDVQQQLVSAGAAADLFVTAVLGMLTFLFPVLIVVLLLVVIFDVIVFFVCNTRSQEKKDRDSADDKRSFCEAIGSGIIGSLTNAISRFLYRVNYIHTNLSNSDRLQVDIGGAFYTPANGFATGNGVTYTVGVENTLEAHRRYSMNTAKSATFIYQVVPDTTDPLPFDYPYSIVWLDRMPAPGWTELQDNPPKIRTTDSFTTSIPFGSPGLNQKTTLYLREAAAFPWEECWYARIDCRTYGTTSTVHIEVGPTFDILPATVDEFAALEWNAGNPLRFPRQIDHDNDGWLASHGDPYDRSVDMDRDGLSDPYELDLGSNYTIRDSDFDGLTDWEELLYNTNFDLADSDADGLNDYYEVKTGWLFDYGPGVTRVWSDPNQSDADGDGLTDFQEANLNQNPNVVTSRSALQNLLGIEGLRLDELGHPVLYLPFEDAQYATAFADLSGLGQTAGCNNNACPAAGESGILGSSAVKFDGNDLLGVNDSNAFDLDAFTISFWVKPDGTSSQAQTLVEKGNGNGTNYSLYIKPNSLEVGFNAHDDTCTNWIGEHSGSQTLSTSFWTYVALTFDGSTATFYVSPLSPSNSSSLMYGTVSLCQQDAPLTIGGSVSNTTYFAGDMDNLVVYDRALTYDEVVAVLEGKVNVNDFIVSPGQRIVAESAITRTSDLVQGAGFIALNSRYVKPAFSAAATALRFETEDYLDVPSAVRTISSLDPTLFVDDDGALDTVTCAAVDSCPRLTYPAEGKTGRGAYFDGVNDALTASIRRGLSPTKLSMSVKLEALPGVGQTATLYTGGIGLPFTLSVNDNGNLQVQIGNSNVVTATTFSFANHIDEWVELEVRAPWDYEVLANGVSVYSQTRLGYLSFGVGTYGNTISGTTPFQGILDNIDVGRAYNFGSTSDWGINFDAVDAYTAEKVVNNRLNPNATGARCAGWSCPTLSNTGQFGAALGFDGVYDYLTIAHLLNPAKTPFTLASWFKVNNLGSKQMIATQDEDGQDWLYVNQAGYLASNLGGSELASTQPVVADQWHHATLVYDGAVLSLYLDGVVITGTRTVTSSDGGLTIGVDQNLSQDFLAGSVDEVVVFREALSANLINQLIAGPYPALSVREPLKPFAFTDANTAVLSNTAVIDSKANTSIHTIESQLQLGVVQESPALLPATVERFLQAHVAFDEPPGASVFENFGSTSIEGTCTACPVAGFPGVVNKAVYFNGRDQAVTLNGFAQPYPGASAWVNAERGTIIDVGTAENGYKLSMDGLQLRYTDVNTPGVVISNSVPLDLPVNQWFFVAVGYQPNGEVDVWVNGTSVVTSSMPALSGLGNTTIGSSLTGTEFLQGYVDDVRQYNDGGIGPLQAYFVDEFGRYGAPVLQLNFDESATADTFIDSSQNGYQTTTLPQTECVDVSIQTYVTYVHDEEDFIYLDMGNTRLFYESAPVAFNEPITLVVPICQSGQQTFRGGFATTNGITEIGNYSFDFFDGRVGDIGSFYLVLAPLKILRSLSSN